MSWGERSCYWLYLENKPCKPTFATCNVKCKYYQSNGKEPDSVRTHLRKMDEFLEGELKGGE